MITAQYLTKKYGSQTVLNIESLDIPKGESFGLVGNNGAGKTTTLRAVSGFLVMDNAKVSDGFIRFDGEDIQKDACWILE